MNEADICRIYILPKFKSAGWEDEYISEQMKAEVNALRELQVKSGDELSALMLSLLDKAFEGEL